MRRGQGTPSPIFDTGGGGSGAYRAVSARRPTHRFPLARGGGDAELSGLHALRCRHFKEGGTRK